MDRRKELKFAYKQTPTPMGVYRLTNKQNGKILIGSSMNLPGKKNSILFQLKQGAHPVKELQADWTANGPDAFDFEVLENLKHEKIAADQWRGAVTALEDKWLSVLQPYGDRGYNKQKEK
ncbi:MAG: GIY-YIG nuclease family protein [Sporomusa sp.]